VSTFHLVLGIAVTAVNAAAGLLGAWCWWRRRPSRAFWPLLRAGQALVAVTAADGVILLALGEKLPALHLIYGLTPLGVSFVGEQLRLASADSVLQARDLEGTDAVRALPEGEQRALVAEIVRREMGVMAASALVVVLLALRAGTWI
jgi:hypothetical protein